MKVVLLERVENLGAIGDVVTVKDGFARNFLLPRDKALRATSANLKVFEAQRAQIEARNEKAKAEAGQAGEALDGSTYVLIRQAGESGQLYGSVTARDVSDAIQAEGGKVERSQVVLNVPIKTLGVIRLNLGTIGFEQLPVGVVCTKRLLVRKQVVASETVLDGDDVADGAELLDAFKQDDFHGGAPYLTT